MKFNGRYLPSLLPRFVGISCISPRILSVSLFFVYFLWKLIFPVLDWSTEERLSFGHLVVFYQDKMGDRLSFIIHYLLELFWKNNFSARLRNEFLKVVCSCVRLWHHRGGKGDAFFFPALKIDIARSVIAVLAHRRRRRRRRAADGDLNDCSKTALGMWSARKGSTLHSDYCEVSLDQNPLYSASLRMFIYESVWLVGLPLLRARFLSICDYETFQLNLCDPKLWVP